MSKALPMVHTTRIEIDAKAVKALAWNGDELIDLACGGTRYRLDGTRGKVRINYGSLFDACAISPSGQYAVLYQRLGTKAIILGPDGYLVREINRSYYCAE